MLDLDIVGKAMLRVGTVNPGIMGTATFKVATLDPEIVGGATMLKVAMLVDPGIAAQACQLAQCIQVDTEVIDSIPEHLLHPRLRLRLQS
jgi:hypothetical protein